MTAAAVSAAIVMAAASVAIARADSAATAARAVRAMRSKLRKGSKANGRSWCTPSVLPPSQDLSLHRTERAEDRLQGFQALDALRLRARQDRAEPDHGGLGQEAARTRPRNQARALPRPLALRHSLNVWVGGPNAADPCLIRLLS